MAKHHKIANAQKLHRKNRQKEWRKIRDGIVSELEREAKAKQMKKAQKAVEEVRKKALKNAEKDRIRLAKKESQARKGTKGSEIRKSKKRATRESE